ncbi:MAG: hypothetical protein SGILL_010664 [Bacillariaceae sp.]
MLQDTDETIILLFHGTVLNDLGEPLENAKVQFWHTDKRGIYDHPRDLQGNGNPSLLDDFAYFGTSTSDMDGKFEFITYRPGIYTGRPMTHIHFKVFSVEGKERGVRTQRLTSQFYFSDENHTQFPQSVQLDLQPVENMTAEAEENGTMTRYFETTKTIVVNMNLGGNETLTPSQQEGPFYPVVNFFNVGHDMTNTSGLVRTEAPSSASAAPSLSLTAAPTPVDAIAQMLSSGTNGRTILWDLTSMAVTSIALLSVFSRVIEF